MTARFCHDALQAVVYSDDAVLLMIGDDEADLALGREAAARAGCHVAAILPTHAALDRFTTQVVTDAVLLFARETGSVIDQVLERLDWEASSRQLNAVVVAPSTMIDAVTRISFTPRITHQFDRDPVHLQVALAAATAPVPPRANDVDRGSSVAMLQQLSEDAARLAATLATLSQSPVSPFRVVPDVDGTAHGDVDPAYVRAVIRARRMRDQYFRGELFADPAFDMLLDLFAARLEGNRVAVSSLCIAAAVPATTALRWIKALTERGLFVRTADPQDGRRVYIGLSDEAARGMTAYLAAVQRAGITAL